MPATRTLAEPVNCPLTKENPMPCPYHTVIIENRNDLKWLKKIISSRVLIDAAAYVGFILSMLKLAGVI